MAPNEKLNNLTNEIQNQIHDARESFELYLTIEKNAEKINTAGYRAFFDPIQRICLEWAILKTVNLYDRSGTPVNSVKYLIESMKRACLKEPDSLKQKLVRCGISERDLNGKKPDMLKEFAIREMDCRHKKILKSKSFKELKIWRDEITAHSEQRDRTKGMPKSREKIFRILWAFPERLIEITGTSFLSPQKDYVFLHRLSPAAVNVLRDLKIISSSSVA